MKNRKKPISIGQIFIYIFLILLALMCIIPLYMVLVNATRSTTEVLQGFSLLPGDQLFNNYKILQELGFDLWRAMFNSMFVSVSATVLCIYFSAMTAYAFTAYDFKFKKFLFGFVLVIIMIPGTISMIGFYRFMLELGLVDSYIPLIIPSIASAPTVFFMKQYLQSTFEKEIIESARIDGAGELKIFNSISIPLMKPAMATMAIFAFVGNWNNYVMPLMLINDESKYTLPMLVQSLNTNIYSVEQGAVYLGIFLTILPLLIVYFLLSKYIISGVAIGGVKG